ncbi:hypothetical protein [Promicromonospora soli]
MTQMLPSWHPGRTRDAITEFLVAAASIPPEDRVAYFDNDGTLWCERPTYVQYEFYADALATRTGSSPTPARRRRSLAAEPITATAERLGWATISMRHDWKSVFAEDGPVARTG